MEPADLHDRLTAYEDAAGTRNLPLLQQQYIAEQARRQAQGAGLCRQISVQS